jgi:SMI1/KNR4 family protein SUKH-1
MPTAAGRKAPLRGVTLRVTARPARSPYQLEYMISPDEAIAAIRHVVQDHGDAHTRLGDPAPVEGMSWFAQLLGWQWPPSYLKILKKHNGVMVCDAILLSFTESFEAFLLHHKKWQGLMYWPVANDGCGNYWTLALAQTRTDGECPVLFMEMISDDTRGEIEADSYSDFVARQMVRQCARADCSTKGRT